MWADALLNSSVVPKLLDTYTNAGEGGNQQDHDSHEDGLTMGSSRRIEQQQLQPDAQPFRRRPGYVQNMGADEETPLLEGALWGTDEHGEDQEKIVK